jgi:hypothetical protein
MQRRHLIVPAEFDFEVCCDHKSVVFQGRATDGRPHADNRRLERWIVGRATDEFYRLDRFVHDKCEDKGLEVARNDARSRDS